MAPCRRSTRRGEGRRSCTDPAQARRPGRHPRSEPANPWRRAAPGRVRGRSSPAASSANSRLDRRERLGARALIGSPAMPSWAAVPEWGQAFWAPSIRARSSKRSLRPSRPPRADRPPPARFASAGQSRERCRRGLISPRAFDTIGLYLLHPVWRGTYARRPFRS
jgi:hypothetical protein